MNRREIVMEIRNFIKELPVEDRFCDDCIELQVKRTTGARGQMIVPFNDGVCRCDLEELMWAYRHENVDRPIECILNGEKTYRRR